MFRALSLFALATSAFAAPALAADAPYRLTAASAPSQSTVVARDVLWRCAGDSCTAGKATSRPAIVCASVARELGQLTSFAANGESFSADDLAKCNSKAR